MSAQPPGTLCVYRWMGESMFMRLVLNDNHNRIPPCPRLYDEVVQIPVVAKGQEPPRDRVRRTPLLADWLADIVENDE